MASSISPFLDLLELPVDVVGCENVFDREDFGTEYRGASSGASGFDPQNCPMCGWHPDGYPANLAYSPELWEWMFSLGLHLNFDPSHLHWLGIDPIQAARSYVDHIAHVQAKDVQIDPTMRDRYGIYGKALDKTNPWDAGWWSYRIPGLGEIDWNRLIDVLYTGGYDGVVSVEHEDPFWSGTGQRVKDGLIRAHRELSPHILS